MSKFSFILLLFLSACNPANYSMVRHSLEVNKNITFFLLISPELEQNLPDQYQNLPEVFKKNLVREIPELNIVYQNPDYVLAIDGVHYQTDVQIDFRGGSKINYKYKNFSIENRKRVFNQGNYQVFSLSQENPSSLIMILSLSTIQKNFERVNLGNDNTEVQQFYLVLSSDIIDAIEGKVLVSHEMANTLFFERESVKNKKNRLIDLINIFDLFLRKNELESLFNQEVYNDFEGQLIRSIQCMAQKIRT